MKMEKIKQKQTTSNIRLDFVCIQKKACNLFVMGRASGPHLTVLVTACLTNRGRSIRTALRHKHLPGYKHVNEQDARVRALDGPQESVVVGGSGAWISNLTHNDNGKGVETDDANTRDRRLDEGSHDRLDLFDVKLNQGFSHKNGRQNQEAKSPRKYSETLTPVLPPIWLAVAYIMMQKMSRSLIPHTIKAYECASPMSVSPRRLWAKRRRPMLMRRAAKMTNATDMKTFAAIRSFSSIMTVLALM
ncbi:hypothetical protein BC830DRAFT_1109021 [Chytriomyces sp. MP71]|nr:hypothetical protein BC830DRAFT_1109021 [Chytriomyces sp. MP71]